MKKILLVTFTFAVTACSSDELTQSPSPLPNQPLPVETDVFTPAFADYLNTGMLKEDYAFSDWRTAGNNLHPSLPLDLDYQRFHVEDYGAFPDDDQEDLSAIQAAIDAATAAGGGYVIFSEGQYDLNMDDDTPFTHENAIWVRGSNVFLVGVEDKTKIKQWKRITSGSEAFDHVRSDHTINFGGPGMRHDSRVHWVQETVQQGATFLALSSPNAFNVGDSINIRMMSWKPPRPEPSEDDFALEKSLLYPLYSDGLDERNVQASYQPFHIKRKVIAVSDNGIEVDIAIPRDLPFEYNPAVYIESFDVTNCGVKNLTLVGPHDGSYAEGYYDSGAVNFYGVQDCWAENLTVHDHILDISLNGSRNVTVRNIDVTGARGHHGLGLYNSYNSLIEDVRYEVSREHMITFNGGASENVVRNVDNLLPQAPGSAGIDFHSGFASFNLLENITNSKVSSSGAKNGNSSSGQYNILWNVTKGNHQREGLGLFGYCWYASTAYSGLFEKYADCYRRHPRMIYIGLKSALPGENISINHIETDHIDEWKYVEGLNGEGVYPRSLYEAQRNKDTFSPPQFIGIETAQVNVGGAFDPLAGVKAESIHFGNLTDKIKVSGEVDTSRPQTTSLTYSVTDDFGLQSNIKRYVVVK